MVAGNATTPTSDRQSPPVTPASTMSGRPARPPGPELPDADEIVISGISGRFPQSADMNEFMENLLTHVNMVTVSDRSFKPGLYGIPPGFGKLKEIDRFDADAFGMLPNQVRRTDPQLRITLETVYEAICDAGVNPADERGSNTGVFLGLCNSESMTLLLGELNHVDGLELIGCSNSMFANRVSFAFDFNGPSCAYDTACSTSIFALEAAVSAMRAGKCDAAIVTASTLILTPTTNIQFNRLGMLSKSSACKSFDKSGDGFARAETVATIYLQRASVARRAYATILHIKTNTDGYKENGITFPSALMQEKLLRDVYNEARINRRDVAYVEAHGTGTSVGDPQEMLAISRIFSNTTANTNGGSLLIGSVKSNMGHAEGASGICSIAKVVIMIQTGVIPANLHYNEPSFALNFVRNGFIKVVDQNTEWNGSGLIAVNSFGFGGVNTHFVLKPYKRKQMSSGMNPAITMPHVNPKLVTFSGRSETGVEEALRKIVASEDHDLFLLVNEMNKTPNPVATVRGFAIWKPGAIAEISVTPDDPSTNTNTSAPLPVHVQRSSPAAPQLWFVFNGIGSQWPGMCLDLLEHPIFANSIAKSAATLSSRFAFDLYALLNTDEVENNNAVAYDDPVNCFVGITACQIGLIDILRAAGIRPHGFLGHSAGEMACAYMDECLTAEETIICAYLRGASLTHTSNEPGGGAMAVVSLSWPQVEKLCPSGSGLYAACHNAIDSVTVSGSSEAVAKLVRQLKDRKKGVKEVSSCGVAFHSPLIAKASARFLADLRIAFGGRGDKTRSRQWISTSIPEAEWDSPLAATASPEYFVNNFLSPVLFYDALLHIPDGATVVEVGPSGLLRGLVKKTCPSSVNVIPLQSRGAKNGQGLMDLLNAMGKLYLAGINFDVNAIDGWAKKKEGVEPRFPVPVSTPFISPLVAGAWDHSTTWEVPYYGMNGEKQLARFDIDLSTESDSFLAGHVVQGRILFPATGYLVLVWRHYAQSRQLDYESCPVVFENVRLHRVTVLNSRSIVSFRIHISEVSGVFEVKEGGAVVASGIVRPPDSNPTVVETRMDEMRFEEVERTGQERLARKWMPDGNEQQEVQLQRSHIYKRYRFYGFEYDGIFKGITKCSGDDAFAVAWYGNWIAFLDVFLQTCLEPFTRFNLVKLPTALTKVVLNPVEFLNAIPEEPAGDDPPHVFIHNDRRLGLIKCRGIEFHSPQTTTVVRSSKEPIPQLFSVAFTPYMDEEEGGAPDGQSQSPILQCMSIVMENVASRFTAKPQEPSAMAPITVVELANGEHDELESLEVDKLLRLNFGVLDLSYTIFTTQVDSEEFRSRFSSSSIQLKGFDKFQKESWLDKSHDVILLHNPRLLLFTAEFMRKGSFLLLKMRRNRRQHENNETAGAGGVEDGGDYLTRQELEAKIGSKLLLVAAKYSATHVVYLIRKDTKQNEYENEETSMRPTMIHVSSTKTNWVPAFQAAIRQQEELQTNGDTLHRRPPRVFLIADGSPDAEDSGIRGLFNCIRKEPYSQQFRMIFFKKPQDNLDFTSPQLAAVLRHDLAVNIFDEHGRWGFYSAVAQVEYNNASRPVPSAFISMRNVGDLTSFRWTEGRDFSKLPLPTTNVGFNFAPVHVHFAALNFKDIMLASGTLPQPDPVPTAYTPCTLESPLGLEFAGRHAITGQRVCGFVEGQAMATQVLGFEPQLWRIPDDWTDAEAATVPVVYATAYMALVLRGGGLQPGESILIHSGAGGVGQAAIRIALAAGATVFTTVGAAEKRAWLCTEFPTIPDSHIGNSRDTSFESLVLHQTGGRGVDVVLNSLTGDKLDASVRCLARHGRFLEIGKFDLVANKSLGLALFLRDASFHGIMLDSLWDASPQTVRRLHDVLQEGIDSGVVRPLPARVFQREQVEPAFRYMGTGKHVGKILIQVRREGENLTELQLDAAPRVYFDPLASYIVVGGLGGIGLELVNWMIERGARRVVLSGRSGVSSPYQAAYLQTWVSRGVEVRVVNLDASREADAQALLQIATDLSPEARIDGFFNLALRLELAFAREQTEASFQAAMDPKVMITRNMDCLTRTTPACQTMRHFVVFSSIVAGIGLPGQTAYGFANAGCEQICESRVRHGLPGKAVELGPISDVGVFYEMHQTQLSSYAGTGTQSVSSVLRCLDVLLTNPEPIVVSRVELERRGPGGSGGQGDGGPLTIVERIGHILGTDISRLAPKTRLTELGLDSIMSMELKQALEQDYGLSLSATEIRTVTLEQLLEMSKNTEQNRLGAAGMGNRSLAGFARPRAATADLFQFDFMRNAKKTKILFPQCVHRLNNVEDRSQGTVFICNSIEGPEILRILGSLIRRPAYSMQFPEDAPLHDLTAMTDYYERELRAHEPKGPYVIAGYSAGTFMAIELALRLEALGECLKLVLIDLTPGRADAILEENFGVDRDHLDETTLMIVTLSQILNIDRAHLEAILGSLPDRQSRIQKAVELGSAFFDEKVDARIFERLLSETQLQFINLFNRYNPTRPYTGRVILVRTTQNLISYDSTENWGIEEWCTQPPIVRTVNSTHSYIVAEPGVHEVAAAINCD